MDDAARPRAESTGYRAGCGEFVGPVLPPDHPEASFLCGEGVVGGIDGGVGGGESKESTGGSFDALVGDGVEKIDQATAVAMDAEGVDLDALTTGMTDEQAYEATARAIAAKVQRQQEGKESSMLGREHADVDFRTVDEIQAMLDKQLKSVREGAGPSRKKSTGHSRYGGGGYGGGGCGGYGYTGRYGGGGRGEFEGDEDDWNGNAEADATPDMSASIGAWFRERCKYIPLRLTYEERKSLRLIQALMKASEYTDLVDGANFKTEQKRMIRQMKCLRAAFTGIIASFDYRTAQRITDGADFSEPRVANTLRQALEVRGTHVLRGGGPLPVCFT